jgi:hypothetical protein
MNRKQTTQTLQQSGDNHPGCFVYRYVSTSWSDIPEVHHL